MHLFLRRQRLAVPLNPPRPRTLAAAVLVALVLTGCGGDGKDYLPNTEEEDADPSFGATLPATYNAIRGFPCEWGAANCNPGVSNLLSQFNNLSQYPEFIGLNLGLADPLNMNSHVRGIQRYSTNQGGTYVDHLVLTRKNVKANLSDQHMLFGEITSNKVLDEGSRYRSNRRYFSWSNYGNWQLQTTYNQPPPESDQIVATGLPTYTDATGSAKSFKEAAGFQVVGRIAAVPVSDGPGLPSQVVLMDVSTWPPKQVGYVPVRGELLDNHLGYAAITRLEDRTYLMAVGSDTSQSKVLFYRSQGTTLEGSTWVETLAFDTSNADWRRYRNVQFATNKGDLRLYAFAFHQDDNADWLDLFLVQYNQTGQQGSVVLTKVGGRHMYCSRPEVADQCHFGYATGLYVDPFNNLLVYGSQPENNGPNMVETTCNAQGMCVTGPTGPASIRMAEFRSKSKSYNPPVTSLDHSYVEFWWDPNYEDWPMRIERADVGSGGWRFNRGVGVVGNDDFGARASSMRWWLYGDLEAELRGYITSVTYGSWGDSSQWIRGSGSIQDLDGTSLKDDRLQEIWW